MINKYLFTVGADIGNSELDLVIDGSISAQPNVIAKLNAIPELDNTNPTYAAQNIHDNLIVTINSKSVVSGTYIAGKYALDSGKHIQNILVGVDNKKSDNNVVLVNLIAQIAGKAAARHYLSGAEGDKVEVDVKLATQLPVTQYNRANVLLLLNNLYEDNHSVSVHLGPVKINVVVKFDYIKVLPESVSTIFYLQKYVSQFKSLPSNYFFGKRILHVGIGEGTTEYPVTNDKQFDEISILGSPNGLGYAIDKAIPSFAKEIGQRKFTRQSYSKILKDPLHKFHEAALTHIDEFLEYEASDILSHINKQIEASNGEIDLILVYGGGSILIGDHLKPMLQMIKDRMHIDFIIVPAEFETELDDTTFTDCPEDISFSVILEALGLYIFATSEIFEKLYLTKKAKETA